MVHRTIVLLLFSLLLVVTGAESPGDDSSLCRNGGYGPACVQPVITYRYGNLDWAGLLVDRSLQKQGQRKPQKRQLEECPPSTNSTATAASAATPATTPTVTNTPIGLQSFTSRPGVIYSTKAVTWTRYGPVHPDSTSSTPDMLGKVPGQQPTTPTGQTASTSLPRQLKCRIKHIYREGSLKTPPVVTEQPTPPCQTSPHVDSFSPSHSPSESPSQSLTDSPSPSPSISPLESKSAVSPGEVSSQSISASPTDSSEPETESPTNPKDSTDWENLRGGAIGSNQFYSNLGSS